MFVVICDLLTCVAYVSVNLQIKGKFQALKSHLGNMHTDPISDMLTRIRNAIAVKHETVMIPHSRVKEQLAKILVREGFLRDVHVKKRGVKGYLILSMQYDADGIPSFHGSRRISKPGKRIYSNAKTLYPIRGGYGRAIISTPEGLLTDREARRKNIGGEILCHVW